MGQCRRIHTSKLGIVSCHFRALGRARCDGYYGSYGGGRAVIQFQAALILSVVVSYENLWVSVLINAPT